MIILALLFARTFDMVTTFLRTPDLGKELNPVVRFLGWRLGLWANVGLVLVAPAFPKIAIAIIVLSVLAGLWNICFIIAESWKR